MAIEFKQVYYLDMPLGPDIALAPVVLPRGRGIWYRRASLTHSETTVEGPVFEGEGGKVVVLTPQGNYTFVPLTLELFDTMKDQINGHDILRARISSTEQLREWFWEEFAYDGEGNEIEQEKVRMIFAQKMGSPAT